jgi:hypothetical protein
MPPQPNPHIFAHSDPRGREFEDEVDEVIASGGSEQRFFSLVGPREAGARNERRGKVVGLALGAILAVVGMGLLFRPVNGFPGGGVEQGALVLVAIVGFLSLGGSLLRQPTPVGIVVSSTGVSRVDGDDQRTPLTFWFDPRLRVVLSDRRPTAGTLGRLGPGSSSGLRWLSPGRSAFDLTPEAFEGILTEARDTGLAIEERGVGASARVVTIRPRPSPANV